jgi:DNA-binding MarR family transcriptional regulator
VDPNGAPNRLRSNPSWLVNQLSAHAHRIVADRMHAAHIAHRYHYALLAALAESGPTSQADLGRRIGLDRSDVTAAISELAGQGSVQRAPDPTDRRRNVVTVTDVGLEHLAAMDRLLADAQDELLAPLSPAQRAEFVRMLAVLFAHHNPGAAPDAEPDTT